jgi:tyrosyl-DNA phosphodiesterase 2
VDEKGEMLQVVGYGVTILYKKRHYKDLSIRFWDLESKMGRKLLTLTLQINGQRSIISTVHLESLKDRSEYRAKQLKSIFSTLQDATNVILMGDFNFCSTWDENSNLDKSYVDVWSALRNDECGWTEDTEINTMRAQSKEGHKQVRFDRILVR